MRPHHRAGGGGSARGYYQDQETRPPATGDVARDAAFDYIARQADRFPQLDLAPLESPEGIDPRNVALAYAIVDATIKHWITLVHLVGLRTTQPLAHCQPGVRAALLAGAAQLLLLDRIPAYAAIDHAVEWTKRRVKYSASGVVNAVLRKVAMMKIAADDPASRRAEWTDQRDELPLADGSGLVLLDALLPEDATERLSVSTSHGRALIRAWTTQFGAEKARDLAVHSLADAPTVLHTAGADYLPLDREQLEAHSVAGFQVYKGPRETLAAVLESRRDLWVQDPTSAEAVASIADLKPGMVMDLCAGLGTKCRQLVQTFPQARVVATDTDQRRHRVLSEVFRGHPRVSVVKPKGLVLDYVGQADLVVLDVPCSNTGVLARRPEAKYRFKDFAVDELAQIQRQLIADAIPLLAPGGKILYSTCSLEPKENAAHVAWAKQWHQFSGSRERLTMPRGGPGSRAAEYSDGGYSVLLSR